MMMSFVSTLRNYLPLTNFLRGDLVTETAQTKVAAIVPTTKQQTKFEEYLYQFKKQNSTGFIPLEAQEQLLSHFEELVKQQDERIERAKKIAAEGGCLPESLDRLESQLKYLKWQTSILKESIKEFELYQSLARFELLNRDEDSRTKKQDFMKSLPSEIQKKLLVLFEGKLEKQIKSNADPKVQASWGGCATAAMFWLGYYQDSVELIKNVIEARKNIP